MSPHNKSYPAVIALDTDGTIWQNLLDQRTWGKGRGANAKIEDNIERVDPWLLRDKTNRNLWIRVYKDISNVVNDILCNGAELAIVSRNTSKAMCDRALYYFNTINPSECKEWSIIHLVKYDEVINESKVKHFRRIKTWSEDDYSDMLMFDDEAFNNSIRIELGATFQLIRGTQGLVWDTYQQGLNAWRRAKNMTIPPNPGLTPTRALIGYSGLPTSWIELVRKGEGIVDKTLPYRLGYALYVASSLPIAKYFHNWNNSFTNEKSYVCEVWVKDYAAWVRTNKIWVPENSSTLPQMNSMNWTEEQTGQNQEFRDLFVASQWGVQTPYVAFSRHFWMKDMPNPRSRWTEMVVYTEIRRSLFEVVPLSDDQVAQVVNPNPYPFEYQMKTWNITVPGETRNEFASYQEADLVQMSA